MLFFFLVVAAVATDTSTKSETQNQIPLQVLSNKNGTENDNEKVLVSEGSKVQDPSPPVANSYMNNLFSISSSVMKRAQGTSAAQYLQVRTCFITLIFILFYFIYYHIISYHIISYHIISYHIISYHIISYHITSCNLMPCHAIFSYLETV